VDLVVVLGLLGIFGAVVTAVAVAYDWMLEQQRTRTTLHRLDLTTDRIVDVRAQQLSASTLRRVIAPTIRRLGRLARRLTPLDIYERLDQELVYAGNPPAWDAERVLAFKLFLPLMGVAGAGLYGLLLQPPLVFAIVGAFLFGAVGYYVPEWILRSRSKERQHRIQLALPDSLDLMSITVEAGLAFDAALARVARNVQGPLGQELFRVVQEMQLGKSRADALRSFADRSTVDDLRSFVLSMVQADLFGIPIAQVLKVQSEEMRLRRRQRAEEQAQKLPVKIVFPVVLCIFPSIFVVLLGPAMIQIYDALLR